MLLPGLEVERHRLLDQGSGFLKGLALADAARKIRNIGGVAALVLRLENNVDKLRSATHGSWLRYARVGCRLTTAYGGVRLALS
jgi:hypothetical protein